MAPGTAVKLDLIHDGQEKTVVDAGRAFPDVPISGIRSWKRRVSCRVVIGLLNSLTRLPAREQPTFLKGCSRIVTRWALPPPLPQQIEQLG